MSIFKRHIDQMSAYKPPLEGRDPQSYTLLDFNERTVPVADHIREALLAYVNSGRLQMYPSYGDITDRIGDYCGVPAEQVMITNGSDHGIELIIRSACSEGDEVIIPAPSFAMYNQVAGVENLNVIEPSYDFEHGYPVEEVISAVSDKTRVIVVCNPNNPSGTLVASEDILMIARAAPEAAILVDECYYEYSKATVASHLEECPNILVTRTFSKTWGLPSIRFGYILSAADNIRALLNVRGPYDINQFAVVAVAAALDKPEASMAYVDEVMTQSKPMLEAFLKERNIRFWPSAANYIWAFPDDAEALSEGLEKAAILVRPKADLEGNLGLRITLGTREQTEHLLWVLEGLLD
ncbi:MAG: histidinol-phosphate transaminase [Candidatus Pelagadaptatus aseana]|uniref:pyridoxal phosphate-dependent aminotransferase n=1 Tax=Candidatus Pelagadaptatus aseana TaxID=3120508 RepID=UPI0039B192DF